MLLQLHLTLTLVLGVLVIRISGTRLEREPTVGNGLIDEPCALDPCEHGGVCVPDEQMIYQCKCTNGYYGANCEKSRPTSDSTDHCRPDLCHKGRCIALGTGYYCQCPAHRYGEHCEKRLKRRTVFKRQSLQEFLKEVKRNPYQPDANDEDDDGRVYYDFKSGIYF